MPKEHTEKKIKLVSAREIGERLGVSQSTLAKWRLTGAGPAFVKIGAKVAYDEDSIQQWLASRIRRSTSDRPEAA